MSSSVEDSAYGHGLGVELLEASPTRARLRLAFRTENSNPGDALHGGCAASLGLIGGQAVAQAALGEAMAPFVTVSCHVSYLSAAVGEDVVATSSLSRRGKELCFVTTAVTTPDGRPVSGVTSVVRGRAGAPCPALPVTRGDNGEADPGPMGRFVGTMPFTAARHLAVEHMAGGRARLVMPLGDANADTAGAFHEGAVLALLDTTGAMAAWASVGPGPYKASTAALQAQILDTVRAEQLVGFGWVVHRDGDLFWSEVEIADAAAGRLQARGTVLYRIVT